jgi:hypothetical protein
LLFAVSVTRQCIQQPKCTYFVPYRDCGFIEMDLPDLKVTLALRIQVTKGPCHVQQAYGFYV